MILHLVRAQGPFGRPSSISGLGVLPKYEYVFKTKDL